MKIFGIARAWIAAGSCGAVLACALALTPGSAAARTAPADPELSPRLAELAKPGVRGASRAEQARRLDLAPSGPGSLLRDGGRVLVEVGFEMGAAAAVDTLRSAGAEIVHVSRRYQTVTVAVRPDDLRGLGEVPRVQGVEEVLAPVVRGVDCGGLVRSEGDTHLLASAARAGFGLDGTGVTVGILSDSFDRNASAPTHAAEDVASGDLPGVGSPCGSTTPIGVLSDPVSSGSDEGRAMAQIVRDLAPGAAIDFATAFSGETAFADNIRALREAGAEVIVDDVAYYAEPFFQDGPVAVAVDEVTAAGASYFSSAGNDNLFDSEGNSISSWEAPVFREAETCPSALGIEHCMDFDPGEGSDSSFGLTVAAGATLTVDFQWAEPWQGVESDLDIYLLDAAGEPIESGGSPVGGFGDNPGVSQKPFEFFQWENASGSPRQVQLAVHHCFGPECNPEVSEATPPRLKIAVLQNGSGVTATEYPQSAEGDVVGPTIFGHTAAAGAISTAAVRYNTTTAPEGFSSRGPVTHVYGPVDGATPAAPLPEPETISKPDVAATDGALNTFFGSPSGGFYRFFGTSAAAPHAAAVAALVRQGNPAASATQVREALTSTARPVGAFGPLVVGAGLLDAESAVASLYVEPPPGEEEGEAGDEEGEEPTDSGEPVPPSLAVAPAPAPTVTRDATPPRTWIAAHPRRVVRAWRLPVRLRFRFRSDERGATFICRFDRRSYRPCRRKLVRRFGAGRHVIKVRARDAAGNVDRSPAVFRFRVKRVR
jgi:hypothetical protein